MWVREAGKSGDFLYSISILQDILVYYVIVRTHPAQVNKTYFNVFWNSQEVYVWNMGLQE